MKVTFNAALQTEGWLHCDSPAALLDWGCLLLQLLLPMKVTFNAALQTEAGPNVTHLQQGLAGDACWCLSR
jgi:hypothetical protein